MLNAADGGRRKFIMVQLPEPCDEDSEAAKAGYAIAPAIKGFDLHQGGTGSVASVICGRDGARPSQWINPICCRFYNICKIGKERIRRAGKKIAEELAVKNAEIAKKNGQGELGLCR